MIRYFCDRCEVEVESQSDLNPFTTEVGDVATTAGWRLRRDLCQKCLDESREVVNKFFARNSSGRRKSA